MICEFEECENIRKERYDHWVDEVNREERRDKWKRVIKLWMKQ